MWVFCGGDDTTVVEGDIEASRDGKVVVALGFNGVEHIRGMVAADFLWTERKVMVEIGRTCSKKR